MSEANILKEKAFIEAEKMRQMWAKGDAIRDEGLVEPAGIRKVCNVAYTDSETEEEKRWHLTDIYYPKETMERYPVIVSVHGGGWFYGDKELYRFYAMHLAEKGFAVVNFNYRLSPQYQYPCGFLDVCRLMAFLAEHVDEYQLDTERIYMVGDSAGAQLVSQYCIFVASGEYRSLFDKDGNLTLLAPAKVALNCGIYDMQDRLKNDANLCEWYLPKELSDPLTESFVNVLDYMNEQFPETYLMCSVNDALMPRTMPMREKLTALKVPFVYREFGQDNPADGHVFHVNLKSENGLRCNQEEVDFFS